jgi:hypothetical protein
MIEIALKPGGDESGHIRLGWVPATHLIEIYNINFNRTKLRIDGVVYSEDSEAMREAFKKAKIWMALKND